MGYAFQKGWLPLGLEALSRAIELNGTQIENNLSAFAWGRRVAADSAFVHDLVTPHTTVAPIGADDLEVREVKRHVAPVVDIKRVAVAIEEVMAPRVAFLTAYQNAAYARDYRTFIDQIAQAERHSTGTTRLAEAAARYLFKLMAYKDEYEVARLYTDGAFLKRIEDMFEGDWSLRFHLAPPLFSKRDGKGHLIKRAYGPGMLRAFKWLARARFLRHTAFDPFGYTAERRAERALISTYRNTIAGLLPQLTPGNLDAAVALATLPEEIRGYGHVKEAAMEKAETRRVMLLQQFAARSAPADGKKAA